MRCCSDVPVERDVLRLTEPHRIALGWIKLLHARTRSSLAITIAAHSHTLTKGVKVETSQRCERCACAPQRARKVSFEFVREQKELEKTLEPHKHWLRNK